jgi:hypothetical protein
MGWFRAGRLYVDRDLAVLLFFLTGLACVESNGVSHDFASARTSGLPKKPTSPYVRPRFEILVSMDIAANR